MHVCPRKQSAEADPLVFHFISASLVKISLVIKAKRGKKGIKIPLFTHFLTFFLAHYCVHSPTLTK